MTKKPINYSNSSIYKIVCKDPSITDCYVGSTTNLIKRRASHKFDCNNEKDKRYNFYVYQFIREHGGFDNFQIIEIEKFNDCEDKESLLRRERYYLEKLGAKLNKVRPIITIEEHKETIKQNSKEHYEQNRERIKEKRKEYREQNRERINEKAKEHYKQNRERIKEKVKEYREQNKERINEKAKEHYEQNKQKIKEYREQNRELIKKKAKEKITCECGSIIVKYTKQRHYRSIKHQNYLNNLNLN